MKILSRGLTAAVLLAAPLAAAPAALADTAHVRIEGDGVSLAKTVEVPQSGTFGPDSCPYDSPGGAIEVATGGDWDQSAFTHTILGETHDYAQRDWWNFWLNRDWSNEGICATTLDDGDEVLMIVQRDDASFNPTVFPLFVTEAPGTVERGRPARVTVAEHTYSYSTSTTTRGPAEGATVAGGGATATTGSDGVATLTFDRAGDVELRATKASRARSNAVSVVVTEPGQAPPPQQQREEDPPPPARPCLTNGADGRCGTRDLQPPIALITSIREGEVYDRGAGPRELSGTAGILGAEGVVPDGTGILMIKLRLTRRVGPRCSTWSPTRERFVPRPCGAGNGFWFRIGERADWEYVLPGRLRRGRYVLDADAIDRAGNRLRVRRRGENRVVFRVG
ncbi:MAG TPA: hypothetical protein VHF89_13780 [Solirubrobacteraceae bacterium]|nr:hypothetical protein [Solirubrobacteraceae bacterium]